MLPAAAGEAKIFAEVHPDSICKSVESCSFVAYGSKESLDVKASAEVPFAVLSAKPQLRECFIKCELPDSGLDLRQVTLADEEGAALAVHTVEVPSPRCRKLQRLRCTMMEHPAGESCCWAAAHTTQLEILPGACIVGCWGCGTLEAWQAGDGLHARVQEVEELAPGEAKGVGMCVGPIFSETPTLLDWLQYYTALGVKGIHM